MSKRKKIIFLSEMPITNGVIQAQLLPVLLETAKAGYAVGLMETTGRFDSQEKIRATAEKELADASITLHRIDIARFTILPSILSFSWKSWRLFRDLPKSSADEQILFYARNYKFIPFLLWAKRYRGIHFIYSPRGAYVAERRHYRRIKDRLFASLIGWLEKKAIEKSTATIVETEQFRQHLEQLYALPQKNSLIVIPNYWDARLVPASDQGRDTLRKQLGFDGKHVIVYAGTVETWYDFQRMAQFVARLRKKDQRVFFQLFLKEDYARTESLGLFRSLPELLEKNGLPENAYAISSYAPAERYNYLAACDAGICFTVDSPFKTMMLYLKIVDFWGAGLPVIANRGVGAATAVIDGSGSGYLVDYDRWEESLAAADPEKIFCRTPEYLSRIGKYSSQEVLPRYLQLFAKFFSA